MKIRFGHRDLERLFTDPKFTAGHGREIDMMYRARIQMIMAATDERTFRALKALHFEQLKGKRAHQHSLRLKNQWRLILELEGKGADKVAVVVGIEDYH